MFQYILKLYCNVSLTGYYKLFYRILPIFPILLLFYSPVLCLLRLARPEVPFNKCPKVYEINTEL